MNMRNKFIELKKITNEIITKLEKEEDIQGLLDKREAIVNDIISLPGDRDDKKKIYEELRISDDEKKLMNLLKVHSESVKEEIKNIQNRKRAYTNYSYANNGINNLFSKRV